MSSSFRSTTIARLFAGVSAAAALAVAAPVFADPAQQPATTVVPAEKPAVPATGKTVDKTTDGKATTTDMKPSTDAKAPAAPAKSSDAIETGVKEKTKVAANDTGSVKHHHKVAKTTKPAAEKTEAPATTGTAGK